MAKNRDKSRRVSAQQAQNRATAQTAAAAAIVSDEAVSIIDSKDSEMVRVLEDQLLVAMTELELIKSDLKAAAEREHERYFQEQSEQLAAMKVEMEELNKKAAAALEKERATHEISAGKLVAKAEKEAESLKQKAQSEASKIKEEVLKEKLILLQQAEDEKLKVITQGYDDITKQKQELTRLHQQEFQRLMEERQSFEREQLLIEKEKQVLEKQKQRILLMQEDLDNERSLIEESKQSLKEREMRLSPAEVERLQLELSVAEQRLQEQQKMNRLLSEELNKLRESSRLLGGRSTESVFEEMLDLRTRNSELMDEVSNLPSLQEAARLREAARDLSVLRAQNQDLQSEIYRMRSLIGNQTIHLTEMSSLKAQKEAMEIINKQLREEINLNTELMKGNVERAYPSLSQLDDNEDNQIRTEARVRTHPIDLHALVSQTRTIMAQIEPKPRYYEPEVIQAFVAGMASSRLLILQGLSGTGKTSLPRFFAKAIGGHEMVIPVQSNWRDRNDLFGYYNDFTKKYTERSFLQALYTAGLPRYRNRAFFIVLDEFNISQVEYYFADILSEMERDNNQENWQVELMPHNPTADKGPSLLRDGRILPIPTNVWFICTANRDESTFPISDKVYDRAQILQFDGINEPFRPERKLNPLDIDVNALQLTFEEAANTGLSKEAAAFIEQFGKELKQSMQVAFGNRFLEQAASYVPVFTASGSASEGVPLDWLLARKVLRKIEYRPNRIEQLKKLLESLSQLWVWKEKPVHCRMVIEQEIRRLGGSV
ncbi:AAA family ATPase [Paenibacillus sp. GCM10023248]|uniref:AAA family ATPase n=1 Tax=unclassified Paenibacillus TaxID=185978 RepID=UPI002378BB66|nr:AAA family ATPase [Paenibacillus sp. MAHUQ-63]MDD9271489.1 AAA family ATPase [Paenibacillus sp. MAHUQ-63]